MVHTIVFTMVYYKVAPLHINKNKSAEYYNHVKQRNKENDEKCKKKTRNICLCVIVTIIIIVALCA